MVDHRYSTCVVFSRRQVLAVTRAVKGCRRLIISDCEVSASFVLSIRGRQGRLKVKCCSLGIGFAINLCSFDSVLNTAAAKIITILAPARNPSIRVPHEEFCVSHSSYPDVTTFSQLEK
jgi:hypothetical protein